MRRTPNSCTVECREPGMTEQANSPFSAIAADALPLHRDGRAAAAALDVRLAGLDRLESRIGEIVRTAAGRVAFSTSLGVEDQAILHAIASAGAAVDVFTL